MTNPYNDIDPRDFPIRSLVRHGGWFIFIVDMSDQGAFPGCVFRDHLTRFIIDEFQGESHLGNDDRFVAHLGNNLALAIREDIDVELLRREFRVL